MKGPQLECSKHLSIHLSVMKIGHAGHFLNEALEKDIGHLFYFYIDI